MVFKLSPASQHHAYWLSCTVYRYGYFPLLWDMKHIPLTVLHFPRWITSKDHQTIQTSVFGIIIIMDIDKYWDFFCVYVLGIIDYDEHIRILEIFLLCQKRISNWNESNFQKVYFISLGMRFSSHDYKINVKAKSRPEFSWFQ